MCLEGNIPVVFFVTVKDNWFFSSLSNTFVVLKEKIMQCFGLVNKVKTKTVPPITTS